MKTPRIDPAWIGGIGVCILVVATLAGLSCMTYLAPVYTIATLVVIGVILFIAGMLLEAREVRQEIQRRWEEDDDDDSAEEEG